MTTLSVYVPSADSDLQDRIWRGSGIVGSEVGDTGRIRLDYEGDEELYPTYTDRLRRAAERHLHAREGGGQGYPTRACAHVSPDEVVRVGRWDPNAGRLEITDQERVDTWLT